MTTNNDHVFRFRGRMIHQQRVKVSYQSNTGLRGFGVHERRRVCVYLCVCVSQHVNWCTTSGGLVSLPC